MVSTILNRTSCKQLDFLGRGNHVKWDHGINVLQDEVQQVILKNPVMAETIVRHFVAVVTEIIIVNSRRG